MDDQVPNVRRDWAWVVAAPLGYPVVPEVKIRSETSSGWTSAALAAVVEGMTDCPAARNSRSPTTGTRDGWRARRGGLCAVSQEDDPTQRAYVLFLQQRGVVGAQEAADRDQGLCAGAAHDVGGLTALESCVQRDQDRATPQQAKRRKHPLGAVGRPDGDPVTGLDPRRHEGPGVAVHLLPQLREGQPHVTVDERLRGSVAPRGILHQPGNGAPDQVCPWVFLVGGGTTDPGLCPHAGACARVRAHGCWLLTEMTSPDRYEE